MFETTTQSGSIKNNTPSESSDTAPSATSDASQSMAKSPGWLTHPDSFVRRHIGPDQTALKQMLETCGFSSLDDLAVKTVPASIRLKEPLHLPPPKSEHEALTALRTLAGQNQVFRSYLGLGYYDCLMPPVIQRNILENPGWYTQYTPYQAEISQGRLEALLNFQTMVCDLTAMEIANASLLDEATAAAEAMTLSYGLKGSATRHRFFVSKLCHPQIIDVVRTRAWALGIEVVVGSHETHPWDGNLFGALVQYPATDGVVYDYQGWIERIHAADTLVIVATDLLSLTLLRPPGEFGADVVIGNSQRFGVPLGYGGPHAAFFATRDMFKRHMPGRLVGVSKDSHGRPGLRLALQTREQHIRREKATSNICTAQVLLAILASMYAVYHGPEGLRKIAWRVHGLAKLLARGLEKLGFPAGTKLFFDTVTVELSPGTGEALVKTAAKHRVNLRLVNERTVGIALDETTTLSEVELLWRIFNQDCLPRFTAQDLADGIAQNIPAPFARQSAFLTHPVFNRYHSETEMLRYLRRLESRDLSLTVSMIPLGSCTMKLNATVEMLPISWPEFSRLHPFAPVEQTQGYQLLCRQLGQWLAEITGFAQVSLQPNAGSQGEYAGLLTIRKYHDQLGQGQRRVCLIPQSAHGTNPASAVMAGFNVVPVACDKRGNIDIEDLRHKCQLHEAELACLMVTYPSTHGVFEAGIKEICRIVHAHRGQVYMDGANMNAQVGLCRPADIGADVCHLNLHKTFAIPHGGGGPGVGPICVAQHLVAFLPGHVLVPMPGRGSSGAVAAAPYGSAGILPIAWAYIALMGAGGLRAATQVAILNANYIAKRLAPYFPVLYKDEQGWVAHECILDLRQFKSVTVEDVAKRLMDYGFHAPTISWPVPGTIMVEPTESEPKAELDRFCEAMIHIHGEIEAIESGAVNQQNNLLKNAPHTAAVLLSESWDRPYSREQAAFPVASLRDYKFWPSVGRIDNVYGDRNPVCTCVGMEVYT